MEIMYTESYLAHHGIKGQKWGERRFQNEDGSLTAAGRERYLKDEYKQAKKAYKDTIRSAEKIKTPFLAGRDTRRILDQKREMLDKAELAKEDARIAYKSAKGGYKSEDKAYTKLMKKYGLSGSVSDYRSGGKGTAMYDHIAAQKGEQYAKMIEKRAKKEIITSTAVAAAATIGLSVVSTILQNKSTSL